MFRRALCALGLLVASVAHAQAPVASPEAGGEATRGLTLQQMREEKRVALVIGNGRYQSGALPNPPNDAHLMADTLRKLGFEVIERINATQKDMKIAIRDFGDKIQNGGVAVFYYAGHGVQVDGRNYLVPIGARINREQDIDIETVDVSLVMASMDAAKNRLNVVILDACRNNPFARASRSGLKGLAQPRSARGTLIAYATAPGEVAEDGSSKHSSYTYSLTHHMRTPGLAIESLFKTVRSDVGQKTNGQQTPWESSSITGDFYFVLPDQERPQVPVTALPPEPALVREQPTAPPDSRSTPPMPGPDTPPERQTPPNPLVPIVDPPKPSGWGGMAWVGVGLAGTGLLTMGAGGILGLAAKADYDDVQGCSGTLCDTDEALQARNKARETGDTATVVVVSGAAFVALGGVLWFIAPRGQSSKAAQSESLRVGIGAGHAVVRGRF